METLSERETRIARLEEGRRTRQAQTVWPTPDDAGTGVLPLEIAPGRGNLNYSSGFVPTFPTALYLVGMRAVSFARLFQSQPWIAAAVMWMLTRSIRVPLKVYRRTGDDPADRMRLRPQDHALAAAIMAPYDRGSQAQFVMNCLGPVLVHGNSVNRVESGARETIRFNPKDWRFSRPIMPFRDSIEGFQFDIDSAAFANEASVDEVLHVAYWSPTGPIGTSPLQQLGVTLQIEDAAQRFQRALFENGTRPPSAITITSDFLGLKPQERTKLLAQLREDVARLYSGPDQAGKPALLPPGLDWKPVGQTTVEAELIDQRKVAREEVAAVYQIPAPLLGIMDKACLPADALISTDRGPLAADSVRPGDRVWAVRDGKLQLSTISWARQTGVEPVVTLRTGNRTLRCTDNHPVLVAQRHKGNRTRRRPFWTHEWVPAGDLQKGDLIVTAERLPDYGVRSCPTRENVTAGFAEFCGLLLGDGNIKYDEAGTPSGIGIARAADVRYMDHYRRVMREEFTQLARGGRIATEDRARLPIKICEQERQTRFSSRAAAAELVELGLAGTAHTKRVPEWVGALAPDLRAAFIRGFADADGSVDKRGHLTFHSANETLIRQIRDLCIGLGVPVCNLRVDRSWVKLPNGQKIFSVMWKFKAADPVANASIISSHDPIDRERMENGKPWGRKCYRYPDPYGVDPPVLEGCGLARVISVERGEVSIPVYDIEVPEGHNFVVDGVVTHNTYANISTQREMTYTDCLGPPLVLLEQAINAQVVRGLLKEDDVFVEFDFGAVLRGDRLQEIDALRDAIGSALMTPNEGRSVLNLQKGENPAMDEFYLPFNNLQPVGQGPVPNVPLAPGQPAPPAPDSPPIDSPEARRLHVRSRDADYELALS